MTSEEVRDAYHMRTAIRLALRGREQFGDRPFGCVVVDPYDTQVGFGWGTETPWDPTRHCEITAIRMACTALQTAHLHQFTLYTTHEPCVMCCGAIIHAQIKRVVWGSSRSDLPTLFHQRVTKAEFLLADTSDGRISMGRSLRTECVRLFHDEAKAARP